MSKPLISIFLPHMYGNGLDRVVLNLAKDLSQLGNKIDLVVPEISGYQEQATSVFPDNVRNVSLDLPVTKTNSFKKPLKLSQYLKSTRPDIFLVNNDYVGITNLARILSGSDTKVIHGVHINVSHYFGVMKGVRSVLRPNLLKIAYQRSDGIIAVSKGVAEDLSQIADIPLKNIKVIYNPVVTSDLPIQAQEPLDHSWFQPEEPPVILGAGRLMHQKGYPTLIRAFAQVKQKRPCRLVIIGNETDYRFELEALSRDLGVAEDICMPGFQENPYKYMKNAAVFVMSSQYEGFGNVLVEAMATGTPVVSTNCKSGPAEILENGKYGQLVPVGDANKLAEAILDTLENPKATHILQQRSQEFTTEAITQKYLSYFDKIISKK